MDRNFDIAVSKLILLFAVEQIEFPILDETLIEICSTSNTWIEYFICRSSLKELIDSGLLCNTKNNKHLCFITTDGHACLSHFFHRIPVSIRNEMIAFIKENRIHFKRKQEYTGDYFKNIDGSYTVVLKINDGTKILFELKIVVQDRIAAKSAYKNWAEKASQIYLSMYESLLE